jgi:hypothetical protein
MTIEAYKAAREFLLAHRGDYATAYRDFRWPEMEQFNWALDWFDRELAHGPTRCCCTSPPAPPASPSWCCTRTRATRWATCRRCTGSA